MQQQYYQNGSQNAYQIVCPRCGSNNVFQQVMKEQQGGETITRTKAKYKQKKHGLLWWFFIGWWWWIIDLVLWLIAFPLRLAYGLLRKKKYTKKEKTTTIQTNQIVYRKLCTCQQCGNVWTENV